MIPFLNQSNNLIHISFAFAAGSKRIKHTGAEGACMKEGVNTNKGLFVLGQVVLALLELGQCGSSGG